MYIYKLRFWFPLNSRGNLKLKNDGWILDEWRGNISDSKVTMIQIRMCDI